MNADIINALWEGAGSIFAGLDLIRLLQQRGTVSGIFWPGRVFFTAWGFWNVFYYPFLNQPWSLLAAIVLAVVNLLWIMAYGAGRYARHLEGEYIDDRSSITFGDLNDRH